MAGVITPNQFKKGTKIEVDNTPYTVVDYQHIKMGRGGATVRTKMKSLLTGNVVEKSFRSDEKVSQPDFVERGMQYLYNDGKDVFFMDNENFDQISIPQDTIGQGTLDLMEENVVVRVLIFNQSPIGIELPNFVDIEIAYTEPGLKGDTVSNTTKQATLSTKGVVNVPLFINTGDTIKIDTRDRKYIERVSTGK